SLGNIVVPWDVINQHGADAFRWYYFTSKQPWDGYLFNADTVGESVRQFLLQLWNTYGFYVLYANLNDVSELGEPETELDRWAISRLHATTATVRERLDDYDATRAGQASSTSSGSAMSRRPTSSAPTRSSRTTGRSARASAATCRRWRRRSPRSTPRTWPTPCARTGRSASASRATTTSSVRTTCCWRCG